MAKQAQQVQPAKSIRIPVEAQEPGCEWWPIGDLQLPVTSRNEIYPPRLAMAFFAENTGTRFPSSLHEQLHKQLVEIFVAPEGFLITPACRNTKVLFEIQAMILSRFGALTAAFDVIRFQGDDCLLRLIPIGSQRHGGPLSQVTPGAWYRISHKPDQELLRHVNSAARVEISPYVDFKLSADWAKRQLTRASREAKTSVPVKLHVCDPAALETRMAREPNRNSPQGGSSLATLEKLRAEKFLLLAREKHIAAVKALNECLPNFAPVLDHLRRKLEAQHLCDSPIRFSPILLTGEAGVGKSYFCRKLTEALKMPFECIQVAGSGQEIHLTGLSKSWGSAGPSRFAEIMAASPMLNPLIMVDEIDKASEEKVLNALLQVFEPETAVRWVDQYVEVPMDLSRVLFVATANDVSALGDVLLSRFEIFDIGKPDASQLAAVFNSIYRDMQKQFNRCDIFAQTLPGEVLGKLLNAGMTPREARKLMANAMERAVIRTHQQQGRLAVGSVVLQAGDMPNPHRRESFQRIGFV